MKLIRQFTVLESLELDLDFTIKEEKEDVEEGMLHYYCNIVCLENLNMLQGKLTLRGLENVKDPKDAERANLKEKLELWSLELVWNGDDLEDDNAAAVVLQNLHPSPELKQLVITGYRGRQWPTWMMDHQLKYLTLRNIKDVKLLQQLRSMPHLIHLCLENIPGLKKIEFERSQLSSLQEFYIEEIDNLEEVSLMNIGAKIQKLMIIECPCLTRISLPPSVPNIRFERNVGLLLSPAGTIEASSLEKLEVWYCEQLVVLPEYLGKLSSLKELYICYCPSIQSLPNSMRQLTQLQRLSISECSEAFKQQCEDPKSENGSRIQHIPAVFIHGRLLE